MYASTSIKDPKTGVWNEHPSNGISGLSTAECFVTHSMDNAQEKGETAELLVEIKRAEKIQIDAGTK